MEDSADWDRESTESHAPVMEKKDAGETKDDEAKNKRKREDEDGDIVAGGEGREEKRQAMTPQDQVPKVKTDDKNSELEKRAREFWERAPERVKEAAKKARDFGEFKRYRTFNFIHLFSGPQDNLAAALIEGSKKAGIEVRCRSVDIKMDGAHNLRDAEKWKELGTEVDNGDYDGSHGGFPCGSFSRVRWRKAPGYPEPVRSLEHPYGLPSNSGQQQTEADVGTLMATWTTSLLERQAENQKARGVPEIATMENPPGSDTQFECPAWALPEIKEIIERIEANSVEFNTCAYMTKEKVRFFKPAKWAGKLEGLEKLNKVCRCPAWITHKPAVEKNSVEAGVYPPELCNEVATLIIAQWKRTLNLEYWRYQLVIKREQVSELQCKWLINEENKMERNKKKIEVKMPEEFKGVNPALSGENVVEDSGPRSSVLKSAKEVKELEDKFYLGGMRNPRIAIDRSWKMKEAGRSIREAWNRFRRRCPEAVQLGADYGTERATFDEEVARAWKNELIVLLEAVVTQAREHDRDELQFKSPLDPKLWRAWADCSGDPDRWIGRWAEDGVPLGMAKDIPSSEGVFPPSKGKDATEDVTPELEDQCKVVNYKSYEEFPEDATIEVERLLEAGFAKKISKRYARERFGDGTVSRLALLVKRKDDKAVKRRIIVDMKRSGGNDRASCPERIILPRIQDVSSMGMDLARRCMEVEEITWGYRSETRDKDPVVAQLISFDLKDAFCHYGLAKEELKHSLAPLDEDHFILFSAMLFGFKSAPLIMGRLAASIGRLWQSLMEPHEAQLQLYIDDVLMMARGTEAEINSLVAMGLYTLKAFGVNFSLGKGERGTALKWIGVQILLNWGPGRTPGELVYSIPKHAMEEIKTALESWENRGLIPLRDLRKTTGKLSWMAGVIPRIRWAVSVLYAVLADAEREEKWGKEEERAERRDDKRVKKGLVAVKRMGVAREWLIKILSYRDAFTLRTVKLKEESPTWAVITDACPTGYGGILAAIVPGRAEMTLVEAFTAKFTEEEAKMLLLQHGESSSQGPLEALAIIRAVAVWSSKMFEKSILIRSDSVVALGMARKLASPSPIVNYLGGELAMNLELWRVGKVVAQHIPGKLNDMADWLSRCDVKKDKRPEELMEVDIVIRGKLTKRDFFIPPPGVADGDVGWKDLPHHSVAVFHNL